MALLGAWTPVPLSMVSWGAVGPTELTPGEGKRKACREDSGCEGLGSDDSRDQMKEGGLVG